MESSSLEMNFARNILLGIMSSSYSVITSPFMDAIDHDRHGVDLRDYLRVTKEPICLTQMKAKMDEFEYQNIKEFICDFRLMLFNCYRYFGCDSKMGKLAAKLESMFEQKLILLPIDIRVKTSIDAILMDDTQSEIVESGMIRRRCADRTLSTDIRLVTPIKAMMDELEKFGTISTMFSDNTEFQHDPINFLIEKLRKWQLKRQNQNLIRTFDEWFAANVPQSDVQILNNCAEFIQLSQFINAALQGLGLDLMLEEHLKISSLTIEDLEHALLFPRTSRLLCALVPLITTASKNRQSVLKLGLSDYNSWNKLLSERVKFLYKQWHEKSLSSRRDLFIKRYSVDPVIFQVLGYRKPVTDKKQMHELTIFQRCHILLAMCCMTLRLQDSVHSAMDKSVDWENHRVICLGVVGPYEFVRFSGLGEFASFFIYRIEKREIDSELGNYCVQDSVVIDGKRKRKEKVADRYRMPTWYAAEVKKAKTKKTTASNKRKNQTTRSDNPSVALNKRSRRSLRITPDDVTVIPDVDNGTVNTDSNTENADSNTYIHIEKSDNIEKSPEEIRNINNNHSGATSMLTIEEDGNMDVGIDQEPEDEEEDEIPELQAPRDGEFKCIARDLAGVMVFISETKKKIENNECTKEEMEGYRTLLENLKDIQNFFEANESSRKETSNQSRLMLRQEIDKFEKSEKSLKKPVRSLNKPRPIKESESEYESDSSGDRYNESESRMYNSGHCSISRAERLARRQKMKKHDTDSPKYISRFKSRLSNTSRPNGLLNSNIHFKNNDNQSEGENEARQPLQQQVKKKVYRICDDYFTEDLEPVQINADGTLLHLSHDLISKDRYELARKMIAMYKLKTNAALISTGQNGTTSATATARSTPLAISSSS